MSINVSNPNNDISTDGGVKPTLGGGPVSAWAMDTATATATYWSDLATINLGSLDNADASFRLLLSCGEGTSLTTVDLLVVCKQTTVISTTESKIEVLSLTNTTNVTHDDFKLIASATTKGTDTHLWMQSETVVKWRIIELSRQINSDSSTPITYNNGSTWTVTTPTGAVDVTSDWASPWTSFTPIVEGETTAGTGTYTTQIGKYRDWIGFRDIYIEIIWTAHTGTGNLLINGFAFVPAEIFNPLTLGYTTSIFTNHPSIMIVQSLDAIRVYDGASVITVPGTGNFKLSGRYKL